MKLNGTQGTYHSVPQNLQTEEVDDPKKIPSQESVVENGPNEKTQSSPTKEIQEESNPEDEKKPMSNLRKFCFVLSLLQCVLFIVAFGWLIPCKIPRHTDNTAFSHNWKLNFYGQDIVTNLAVSSPTYKPVALIFGFSTLTNASVFGVRALNVFDGTDLWEQTVDNFPENILCDKVDVNNDHAPDCIVTDSGGQMVARDIKNGHVLWYMHDHHMNSTIVPRKISAPEAMRPCPGSSVPFIYVAVEDISGSYFFLSVSGETGQIKEMFNMTECVTLPVNVMWRNAKIDDEGQDLDGDSPLELVMSCANKEGAGIVYSANFNELCGNNAFHSFNVIAFKMAITENNEYPMVLKTINTTEGDNLVGATHDGKIKIFSDVSQEHIRAPFLIGKDLIFTVGHFTNFSLANIAVASNLDSHNSSRLYLLDSSNSLPIWSIPIDNGSVTAIFTIHNAFNSLDGILLKTVSALSEDELVQQNFTSDLNIKHFEEKYLIMECSETGSLKTVSSDFVSLDCQKSDCHPNETGQTAILRDVDNDGTEELVYLSRTALPSSLHQSIALTLVRMTDFVLPKSCSSPCHCSD